MPRERNTAADEMATRGVVGQSSETWTLELLRQFRSSPSEFLCLASFDGGASPNPGPAGCGACVWLAKAHTFRDSVPIPEQQLDWQLLFSCSSHLGIQSNNFAEWHGLLSCLLALVKCRTDV